VDGRERARLRNARVDGRGVTEAEKRSSEMGGGAAVAEIRLEWDARGEWA